MISSPVTAVAEAAVTPVAALSKMPRGAFELSPVKNAASSAVAKDRAKLDAMYCSS